MSRPVTTPDPIIRPTGFSHVRLTVTDIRQSRDFYRTLLGADPAVDFSDQVDQPDVLEDPERLYGGCAFAIGDDQLLGLRPVATQGDRFDSTRVGLDHLSLQLTSLDDLRAAESRLSDHGVEHGELKELGDLGLAIVSVQDPDDINLELSAPLTAS